MERIEKSRIRSNAKLKINNVVQNKKKLPKGEQTHADSKMQKTEISSETKKPKSNNPERFDTQETKQQRHITFTPTSAGSEV